MEDIYKIKGSTYKMLSVYFALSVFYAEVLDIRGRVLRRDSSLALRMTNGVAVLAVEARLRVKCFCEDRLDIRGRVVATTRFFASLRMTFNAIALRYGRSGVASVFCEV